MARKQSRTVDLRTLTFAELDALALAGGVLEGVGTLPDAAVPAWSRLLGVREYAKTQTRRASAVLELYDADAEPLIVSKLPRHSLAAFAGALRPYVADAAHPSPELRAGFAKLAARLRAGMGPRPTPDLWEGRARDAARAADELRRALGHPPADRDIEAALSWKPGVLRKWRNHRPDMFLPAA